MDNRKTGTMIYHEKIANLPVLRVQTKQGSMTVSLYGGHILSWVPADREEVFYVSPLTAYENGKAIRGGVPVCWPWFGKARMPQHGLARTAMWELVREGELEGGEASLVLSFQLEGENQPSLEMEIIMGESLTQKLTTHAGGEKVIIAEALHSYFLVGDITQVSISGLENKAFIENAKENSARSESPLVLQDWMDRIYTNVEGELKIRDESLNRTIVIRREGSRSVVVWNPWEEGAKGIADIPDEAWRDYICVETANVTENNAIILGPGESHTMVHRISVE